MKLRGLPGAQSAGDCFAPPAMILPVEEKRSTGRFYSHLVGGEESAASVGKMRKVDFLMGSSAYWTERCREGGIGHYYEPTTNE